MLYALAALAALPGLAFAYSNPESCSGVCIVSDPGLMRRVSDGKYFLFSTGGEITFATADSLLGPWTGVGSVLPGGSSIDLAGNTDLWVSYSSMIIIQPYHSPPRIHPLTTLT